MIISKFQNWFWPGGGRTLGGPSGDGATMPGAPDKKRVLNMPLPGQQFALSKLCGENMQMHP